MAEPKCATCAFRAKHDNNPRSILGRLWRWHINWCPGWKSYMKYVSPEERASLADKYDLKKYKA